MNLEQYLPTIAIAVIGGLLGLVIKGLGAQISRMEKTLLTLMTKELCDAHRATMKADINNLGTLVRSK